MTSNLINNSYLKHLSAHLIKVAVSTAVGWEEWRHGNVLRKSSSVISLIYNSETNMDYYVSFSILSFQDISDVSCWDWLLSDYGLGWERVPAEILSCLILSFVFWFQCLSKDIAVLLWVPDWFFYHLSKSNMLKSLCSTSLKQLLFFNIAVHSLSNLFE